MGRIVFTQEQLDQLRDEELYELRVNNKSVFNPNYFSDQIETIKKEIEIYKNTRSDFKYELKNSIRLYDSLKIISEWFKKYNLSDYSEAESVSKTTRLCQLKIFLTKCEVNDTKFTDYAFMSGMYSPVDLYIIPLSIYGVTAEGLSDKGILKLMNKIAYDAEENNSHNLPKAYWGSMRLIDSNHVAVVATNNTNPISYKIRRSCNWRYIHTDGFAM